MKDHSLLIIWQWQASNKDSSSEDYDNGSDVCDSSSPNSEDDDDHSHAQSTVAFKCIGVKQDPIYQTILREVKDRINNEEHVPVRLEPEPTNPFDTQAIAFQCDHNHS